MRRSICLYLLLTLTFVEGDVDVNFSFFRLSESLSNPLWNVESGRLASGGRPFDVDLSGRLFSLPDGRQVHSEFLSVGSRVSFPLSFPSCLIWFRLKSPHFQVSTEEESAVAADVCGADGVEPGSLAL